MKRVLIADITTLTNKDRIYGHFAKVAQQYYEILSPTFDVKIAGGKTYKYYFNNSQILELPYSIMLKDNYGDTKAKIKRKFKEVRNAWIALHSDMDVVIFQCLNETPIYFCLLFGTKSKVCIIQYQRGLDNLVKKIVYRIVRKRITGVISSSLEVAKYYGGNAIVLPDYFPINLINQESCNNDCYDIVVLGTISEWKNYEDIIISFNNTDIKVLIAGKFKDSNYFEQLKSMCSSNVIIKNQYLSDQEYIYYMQHARYVALPYKKEYTDKSSGVMLEALYASKPVIAPNINTFDVAQNPKCGLFYDKSISEIKEKITNQSLYRELIQNTLSFSNSMGVKKQELVNFIDKCAGK